MANIHSLLQQVQDQQTADLEREFVAPCLPYGLVRTRVAGLIQTFTPRPRDFEGWGIYRIQGTDLAQQIQAADSEQIEQYLTRLKAVRVRLICLLKGMSWLAYPINEPAFAQLTGWLKPFAVHIVTGGTAFQSAIAHWDGQSFWYGRNDYQADPTPEYELQTALQTAVAPEELRFKGLTPEMRIAYQIAAQTTESFAANREEMALRRALEKGGGQLQKFSDQGDYWQVQWTTSTGEQHTSAITKNLTVISAGYCLDGRDRDFDLSALVGVTEKRYD